MLNNQEEVLEELEIQVVGLKEVHKDGKHLHKMNQLETQKIHIRRKLIHLKKFFKLPRLKEPMNKHQMLMLKLHKKNIINKPKTKRMV